MPTFQEFPPEDCLQPVTYMTALSWIVADGIVSRKNPKPAANTPIARMTRLGWRPHGIHRNHGRNQLAFLFVDPSTPDVPGRERVLILHNCEGLEFAISRGGLSLPIASSAYVRAGLPVPATPMEFALPKDDRDAADWVTTVLNPY